MLRRFLQCGMVALLMAGAALGSLPPSGGVAGFGDVPEQRFFTEAVQWMVDNDITTGTSPTCFSPTDPVTRGQAAAFMWRMEGEPDAPPHPFTDINAAWQQEPVSWMYANGITTGTSSSTYSPNDVLTRGQLAALLHRLAGNPTASPHPFTDVVASWQQGPVSWMATTDPVITTGTSPTTFSPNEVVTRGQLATFFWRYKGEPSVTVNSIHPSDPLCRDQVGGPTTTTTTTTTTAPRPGYSLASTACEVFNNGGYIGVMLGLKNVASQPYRFNAIYQVRKADGTRIISGSWYDYYPDWFYSVGLLASEETAIETTNLFYRDSSLFIRYALWSDSWVGSTCQVVDQQIMCPDFTNPFYFDPPGCSG